MKREYNVVSKILVVVFLVGLPYVSYVAIKSSVERKGREIKRIEAEILRTKKSINNLERIFPKGLIIKRLKQRPERWALIT